MADDVQTPADDTSTALALQWFLYEQDGPIVTVTFNRPERRNGLNAGVLSELERIVQHIRDDRSVRVVIITGAGPVFCAGAEPASVSERAGRGDMSGGRGGPRVIGRVFDQLASLEQISIMAVNGHAVGGGWSLCLAGDYCLAVPEAQFWVPEVELGVPFRGLSNFALTHRMGPWLAKEATILCRRFGADELRQLGVINRVVEPDQLLTEARRVAEQFAALAPKAVAQTKRDVNSVIYGPKHY